MGSSSKKVTVGYKISLGVHMILGHGPFDEVSQIDIDEKVAWTGSQTGNGTITIDEPELFGGEEREGGVQGDVDIEMGGAAQPRNSYLQGALGTNDIPAFRGVAGAVLNRVYIGLNPYLKKWAFWATRTNVQSSGDAQWYVAKARIGNDMNPAHIVRECLVDRKWGMGYAESDLDLAGSFTTAADTLFDEGMGISLLWEKSIGIDEFLQTIMDHIDAALYVDRTTGKFVLSLIRDDYTVGNLLVLGEDDVDRITNVRQPTVDELTNSVTVVFWNGDDGAKGSVTAQDVSLVDQIGYTIATTRQYPGFTTGPNASRAASRDLRALSTPLKSCTVYSNRTASGLNVGDPFVLNFPRLGYESVVMRVTEVELGTLQSNIIKLSCVQDVFAVGSNIYSIPTGTQWSLPLNDPQDVALVSLIEAPYWEIVQRVGEADAESLETDAAFFVVTGVSPTPDSVNAKLFVNRSGTYREAGTVDFCGYAQVDSSILPITPGQTQIPIKNGMDLDTVSVGTYALLGSEVVRVDALTSALVTVGRGCLDTVPQEHAHETAIYFADEFYESDGVEYLQGETTTIKLLPTTGKGTLLEASATPRATSNYVGRQAKPYPPGNFRIASEAYPEDFANDINITVTWAHRDRLQQTVEPILDTTAASVGPEANTLYDFELRTVPGGTLIHSETDINNTALTLTTAEMGANYGPLQFLLWSKRDGIESFQKHDIIVRRGQYEWGLNTGTDELEFNDGTIGSTGAAVFDPTP